MENDLQEDITFTIKRKNTLEGLITCVLLKKLKRETRYKVTIIRFFCADSQESFIDTAIFDDNSLIIIDKENKSLDVSKIQKKLDSLLGKSEKPIFVKKIGGIPLKEHWAQLVARTFKVSHFSSAQINFLVGILQRKEKEAKELTGGTYEFEYTLDEIYTYTQTTIGKEIFKDYVEQKESFLLSFLFTFLKFSYKSTGMTNSHVSIIPISYFEHNRLHQIKSFSFDNILEQSDPELDLFQCRNFTGEFIKFRLSKLKIEILSKKNWEDTCVEINIDNELADSIMIRSLCVISYRGIAPISVSAIEDTMFSYYIKGLQLAQEIYAKEYKCADTILGKDAHNYFTYIKGMM